MEPMELEINLKQSGDEYLAEMEEGYWGRGETKLEAIAVMALIYLGTNGCVSIKLNGVDTSIGQLLQESYSDISEGTK